MIKTINFSLVNILLLERETTSLTGGWLFSLRRGDSIRLSSGLDHFVNIELIPYILFLPSFNFSWAEMVFNLNLPHPPNHPGKYENGQIQSYIEK